VFGQTIARGKRSVVNKITWQKAGRVTEPGRYMFTFGWLTVTADDLAIWNLYPDAEFTLVRRPNGVADPLDAAAAEEFHLGTFDLPALRADDEA
jgi:hypothetical protein